MSNLKIIKNIKIKWKWHGDIYMLRGFNLLLMNENSTPIENLSGTLANATIPAINIDTNNAYEYTFNNITLDKGQSVVPWVQALYDNSDSEWVSMSGAIVEDDGNATIVVIGNPTFQQVIDMADDEKITPQEKLSLEKEWDEIVTDHYLTLLGVEKAALDSMHPDVRNYDDKIDVLASYLNYNNAYTFHPLNHAEFAYPTMLTDKLTTDLKTLHYGGYEKYKQVFRDFYDAKVTLLETIKDAILKNNNDLIQDEIDKNTLPTTIPIGGYTASYFEANKDYNSNLALGTVRIGIGHFITTTGIKYNIKVPETVVTNLNSNKTRTKYILFIGADKSRFGGMNTNFVSALPKGGEWYYFTGANDEYKTFNPLPEDCVVAKLEEHNSSSSINGIRAIKYLANTQQSVFDQLTDGGEQQFIGKDENGRIFINGEYIQAHTIKGQQVIANGLKAVSVEDGRTTFEITETGEAKLDVKNFTLRAGGEINMQGVVNFESLDKDMQGNFAKTDGKTTINGDAIKTGSITANNNKSVFNLNDGTFRLGGTNNTDYKLYFDGTNLNFGDGVIQWPELPEFPEIPDLSDFDSFSISLSKDTHTIRMDKNDQPEPMEIGIDGRAVTTITVHRNGNLLQAVPEISEVLATNEFKYEIKRSINCVAKRRSDTEIYIESLMDNSGVLTLDGDTGVIDIENIQSDTAMIDVALTDGGYIELDVYCGSKKQLFKKAISFSKIKAGEDGQDGQDGAAGEAAKYIKITGDQVFKYDPNNQVDKESIQLRATAYNFAPSKMIWERHDGTNWVQTDGINNQTVYTVRHDSPDWGNKTQLRLRCIMEEMFIDEMTLSKLSDGTDGTDGFAYTVILSNEAHTIACDEDGNPENGQIGITGLATTDVTVYRNTTKLEPVRIVGGDYNQLRENEFAIEIIEQVGCKSSMTDADTIHITSMNSNSGYIGLNIIADKQSVAMKKMSLTKAIKGKPGADGADGVGAYLAVLTNDFHSIPTDKNGNNGNFTGCETSIVLIHGEDEVTEGVTYSAEPSDSVIGVLANNKYTVTNMTTDSGYVDMTATINNKDYTKRFTLSKNKSGQDGESGSSIWILNDANVIHKDKNGILKPNKVTFNAKSQKGSEDVKDYLGKFLISISTDGSTFTNFYESTSPESSYIFNLPNDVAVIKCQLLKADTNSIIDEERIPVVSDGDKGDQGPQGPPGSDAEVPSWVDEWTSNSTSIGAEYVISPKIFAGVNKPDNGGKTGVALGRAALGGADTAENIGLGVYYNNNIIAKMYAVPVNGNMIEFGTGSTKMTVDINGNVSAPKMTANEIVSQINGGSTTISGNKITTGTITARHISSEGISVDYINANGVDPILRLFQQSDGSYCSLDATSYMESGRGNSIRLKWNSNNYVQIGQGAGSSPMFTVYMGDGNADDSKARLELRYDYFNVVRGPGESNYAVQFNHTGAYFPGFNSTNCYNTSLITLDGAANAGTNTGIWLKHDQIRVGTNGAYISTVGGAFRLYTTFDRDIGIRMSSDCKLLELKSGGVYYNGTQLGAQGPMGPQGPQGPRGYEGPQGPPGTTSMEGLSGQVLQASYGWLYLCSSSYSSNYRFIVDTSEGYIFPYGNGGLSLGKTNTRFHGAYFVNSPNISSDSNLKKDILYIEDRLNDRTRKRRSIQIQESNINAPMILEKKDLYDFVKDDLRLVQYKVKASKETDEEKTTIGFLAQDIAYTKVGSILVQNQLSDDEDNIYLSYDSGAYMSIYGGALQVSIEKTEINTNEIDILKQEVNTLKEEIENLKKLIKGEI